MYAPCKIKFGPFIKHGDAAGRRCGRLFNASISTTSYGLPRRDWRAFTT
jgi:hypothetical protein